MPCTLVRILAPIVVLLVASCAPTSATTSATSGPSQTPRSGGTLTFAANAANASGTDLGLVDTPKNTSGELIFGIYEHLYRINATGVIEPWLAQKTDISADGLTWTLTLRSGVMFTDGTPFDAAAVKTNIEIRQKSKLFTFKSQLAPIKEVKVLDNLTVQFLLSQPAPSLQTVLTASVMGMLSPTAYAKYPYPDYAQHPTGTGPFKLESATPSATTLVRNDQYWGPKPYLDRIVEKITPDIAASIAALEAGDVDVVNGIPGPELARLKQEDKVTTYETPTAENPFYLLFNLAKAPFSDKRVRQAVAYGLNTKTYLTATYGTGEIADSIVAPNVFGYAKSTPYPYDPAKAKQLLADAGIAPGTPVDLLTIGSIFASPYASDVVQLVKQDLDRVGFSTTIDLVNQAAWLQKMVAAGPDTTWQLDMTTNSASYPDAEAPLARQFLGTNEAPAGGNWTHYRNAHFDALMALQSKTVDPAARARLLAQAQQVIWDDLPTYPVLRAHTAFATTKSVRDIHFLGGAGLGVIYTERVWRSN